MVFYKVVAYIFAYTLIILECILNVKKNFSYFLIRLNHSGIGGFKMNMLEIIQKLCQEKGISIAEVESFNR